MLVREVLALRATVNAINGRLLLILGATVPIDITEQWALVANRFLVMQYKSELQNCMPVMDYYFRTRSLRY